MTRAFIFPGQGSQAVGMGKALAEAFAVARETFQEVDEALAQNLSRLMWEGPESDLVLTENAQPAIMVASLAIVAVLRREGGLDLAKHARLVAGHSLGEYSALAAAGAFTLADTARLLKARGRAMQQAVPHGVGAMAAILGLPAARISELCAHAADEMSAPATATPADPIANAQSPNSQVVAPANLNSPDQTVISGNIAAVERAAALCKEAGAKRTVMLPVSAPFHCALMQPAQRTLMVTLEGVAFHDPAIPVATNVDARLVTRDADARDCLVRQVTGAVRWVECMQLLLGQGATHFLEVGPGKVLTGLLRQIDRSAVGLHVDNAAALEKTLARLTEPHPPESHPEA
jgi:[acyl-carrier-protein] S-malonyltransferase